MAGFYDPCAVFSADIVHAEKVFNKFYLGGGGGGTVGTSDPRYVEATGDKKVYVGIVAGASDDIRGTKKYERMFQSWKNNPNVTINERLTFSELLGALRTYDAVFLITHNLSLSGDALMFPDRSNVHFGNIAAYKDEFSARFFGFAVCNKFYHGNAAQRLQTSTMTVTNYSVPDSFDRRFTNGWESLRQIDSAINGYFGTGN